MYLCSFLANLSSFNVIYDEDLYVLETFTFGDISLNRVSLTIAMEEIIKGMHLLIYLCKTFILCPIVYMAWK